MCEEEVSLIYSDRDICLRDISLINQWYCVRNKSVMCEEEVSLIYSDRGQPDSNTSGCPE